MRKTLVKCIAVAILHRPVGIITDIQDLILSKRKVWSNNA